MRSSRLGPRRLGMGEWARLGEHAGRGSGWSRPRPDLRGARSTAYLAVLAAVALCGAMVSLTEVAAQTNDGGRVRVEVGVEPDRVTIGEPFTAVVRIAAPPGYQVEYGDVAASDTVQATGLVTTRRSASGDLVAVYPLVAWITGDRLTAAIPVRLIDQAGGQRLQSVTLRLPAVVSVLPPDMDGVVPRPARGLYVPPLLAAFPWWWWLLILLGALLAGILGYLLLKHRRNQEEGSAMDPREWAIGQLSAIEETLGPGHPDVLIGRVSWVVRGYLARVRPELGAHLTTTEVLGHLDEMGDDTAAREIAEILHPADRVKFARHSATAEEATAMLEAARSWIGSYPPAERVDPERLAA